MRSERISIHKGNIEDRFSPHPRWVDENENELEACPFSLAADAQRELHELNELIEEVLDRAPSDANAEVHISKTAFGFDAEINVYSSQRAFGPIQHAGEQFREVIENLLNEVSDEIEQWKRQRNLNVDDGL